MDKNYGIVYVVIGEAAARDCLRSINSVRRYCNYPVKILSDHYFDVKAANASVEIIAPRPYQVRYAYRNSDYFRLVALRDSPWEVSLYLDNDLFVVCERFLDGFEISKNFGMVIPLNSWVFLEVELKKGKDINKEDREELSLAPLSSTAFGCGVVFYQQRSKDLLLAWIEVMQNRPCRGPIALARAIWQTKQFPYLLPSNWLVEEYEEGIAMPIILHLGHSRVKDFYEHNLPLWLWKIIWAIKDVYQAQHKKYLKLRARFLGFVKRKLERK